MAVYKFPVKKIEGKNFVNFFDFKSPKSQVQWRIFLRTPQNIKIWTLRNILDGVPYMFGGGAEKRPWLTDYHDCFESSNLLLLQFLKHLVLLRLYFNIALVMILVYGNNVMSQNWNYLLLIHLTPINFLLLEFIHSPIKYRMLNYSMISVG